MGDNKALQKFFIHSDDSRPTKGGFFCAVVGDKIRGAGISYIFFDFTIDDSNAMHYYNNQKRQGDCNLARSKEMTMYNIDGTIASDYDQDYYKERALEMCDKYHSYDCFVIMPDGGDGYLEPFETITDMGTWLNQN